MVTLPKVAKDNKWIFEYDSYLDELFFGVDESMTNTVHFKVNQEIKLFIALNFEVKGMLIQDFAAVYVKHHNPAMKPVLHILDNEESRILDKDKEKAYLAKRALEGRLLSDVLEALLKNTRK